MSYLWDQLDDDTRAILDGHSGEGVVVVRPSLVRALRGNGNAAILGSELLFWSRRLSDPQGWFFQQQRRLEQQTGLGPDAQRKAIRLLKRLGVLKTDRRGVPARLYYHLDLPRLAALLRQHGQVDSVVDHGQHQATDHGLELDRDDGLQQVAEDGQRQAPEDGRRQAPEDGRRQAAGYGPQHIKIIEENRKESKEKISPSHLQDARTPPRKRGRQSTPKHPLPEDFAVTAEMRAWAAEHAPPVDLDHETLKLIAWARAKGEWRSDWTATWRLWVLNAATPGPQGQQRAASSHARHTGVRSWVNQKREQIGESP